ncbi:GntR family transcriptional regulator [Priestia megaterium]|nr:GntR family transcriptional regulator [Priestia megaterium]
MNWTPNPADKKPMHKQIQEYMKEKITNGEWPIGTKIPSQRHLAAAFSVNRSTVVTATENLIAEGLLSGNKGGGTKVINNTWSLLAAGSHMNWSSYVEAGIYQPNSSTIRHINEAEFQRGIIRLGTGELAPDLLPSDQLSELFSGMKHRSVHLGYEHPKGNGELRQELAKHVKKRGIETSPSSILIVSGSLQALQLISIGLLPPGANILAEKPSYLYSLPLFQSAQMKITGVSLDKEGIQLSSLKNQHEKEKGTVLYTIPNFHNPTNVTMSEQRRQELLHRCEMMHLPIIEDDAYGELWFHSPPPLSLKAQDKNGMVLYLGTLSKTFSPGFRIGWVVGPEHVIERLADLKMQVDYGASSLSQWAAAEALKTGIYDNHVASVRYKLKEKSEKAQAILEKHLESLATWNVPSGGFYFWLTLHKPVSMRKLFKHCLDQGVLLNPGALYDHETSQHIRISFAYATLPEFEYGIKIVAKSLKNLYL